MIRGAEAVVNGGDLYAVTPADSDFGYRYPPVTVLAFVPWALVVSGRKLAALCGF